MRRQVARNKTAGLMRSVSQGVAMGRVGTRLFAGCVAVALIGLAGASTLRAQGAGDTSSSYITPFPEGDIYQIKVVGGWLAEGIKSALDQMLVSDARVNVRPHRWKMKRLMRTNVKGTLASLKRDLSLENAHIAIVTIGLEDRISIRDSAGKRHKVGTPSWRQSFTRNIDQSMKALKKLSIAVYWVGLPSVRRPRANADYRMMNEIIRERAYFNGLKFIDAYTAFSDEQGGYTPYGPDVTGKTKLLRTRDGVYFTFDGYYKLAHFIEREMKRDLKQAKSERSIPLAGSKKEQKRINPENQGQATASSEDWRASISTKQANKSGSGKKADGSGKSKSGFLLKSKGGEQKANNSQINLKTVGANGREKVVTLDIVRPSIPASIVALVTRKERTDRLSRMGDTLVDQIAGGLNIMSSVTPANEVVSGGVKRKMSPARTPFFRVLVKGERLASKPGRADDVSWPRPEPPPLPGLTRKKQKSGKAKTKTR